MDKLTSSQARVKLTACLIASLYCKEENTINHPLRIVQAGKSLIGLNPDEPNFPFIKWLESYVQSFEKLDNNNFEIIPAAVNDFASMIEFENQLIQGEIETLQVTAGKLLTVSSGEPMFEALLGYSINQHELFCFYLSLYRSILFCHGKEKGKFLGRGLFLLNMHDGEYIKNNVIKINLVNASPENLGVAAGYEQLMKMELVRGSIIKPKIPTVIYTIPPNSSLDNIEKDLSSGLIESIQDENPETFESSLTNELLRTGRIVFNHIIKHIPKDKIIPDLILLLDTGRALLRYCKDDFKPALIKRLSTLITETLFYD